MTTIILSLAPVVAVFVLLFVVERLLPPMHPFSPAACVFLVVASLLIFAAALGGVAIIEHERAAQTEARQALGEHHG